MLSTHFYLKNKKKKQTQIILVVNFKKKLKLSTGIVVESVFWDSKKERIKNPYRKKTISLANERLLDLEEIMNELLFVFDKKLSKEEIIAEFKKKINPEKKIIHPFFDVFDIYLERMSLGKSLATVTANKSLKNLLLKFGKASFDFNFEGLIQFMSEISTTNRFSISEKGLSSSTVKTKISQIKTFLRWAKKNGYSDFVAYEDVKMEGERNKENITLTFSEIENLRKVTSYTKAIDLFLLLIFSLQRFGDLNKFRIENFYNDESLPFLQFSQAKSRERKTIRIPLVGFCSPILEILRKYDFELPKMSNQKFNRDIKKACEKAGIDKEVIRVRTVNGQPVAITKKKYELVTSHSARRTGITLLVNKGLTVVEIAKISGHSSLDLLMIYENLHLTQIAERLK